MSSRKSASKSSSRRQRGGQQAEQMAEMPLEQLPSEVMGEQVMGEQVPEVSNAELVQQAIEDASRARRARASRKQSGGSKSKRSRKQRGGDGDGEQVAETADYVDEEVDEELEMEGGWASGALKIARLEQRLRRNPDKSIPVRHRIVNENGKRTYVPTNVPQYNRFRSFRAEVDGVPLRGLGKITRTDKKTGTKSTRVGETNRYFHGTPSGAAKKVVSQLQKGLTRTVTNKSTGAKELKVLPGSRDVTGIDRAVHIRLIEVTAGVRKTDGKNFVYTYYGWRQPLKDGPHAVYAKEDVNKEKPLYTTTHKSVVVPVKGARSAQEAYDISRKLGSEIKQLKTMSASQREQIASSKRQAKKNAVAARKAARASKN